MKHFRRLLPALCLLLISAMCAGTSTYAWFSINNKVEAKGMKVTAKATGSLVIDKISLTTASDLTEVDFQVASATELRPCVYTEGGFMMLTDAAAQKVSASTGLIDGQIASNGDLQAASGTYTQAYSVYVGSQGMQVKNVKFKISVSGSSSVAGALKCNVTVGGTSIADYGETANGYTSAPFDADIITDSFGGHLITATFYFDGNALDSSNKAIVRSEGLSLGDLGITFEITGDNPQG